MSSDVPPEFESDERPDAEALDDGMGPGVGNVLGFSLLFRERRALLALNRRSLAPGVRLRDYEAVIPGVRFPLRGPLNASKFRKHRCRVVRATLAIEDRALRPWLRERLIGQALLGVTIDELELDLHRELPEAEQPRPCLLISGSTRDGGQVWLLVAFDVEPVHRLLVLRPCRLWLLGTLESEREQAEHPGAEASIDRHGRDASARRLWSAIARRLRGKSVAGISSGLQVGEDGTLTIDAGRLAMTRPFASVGWKAPNLEGCAIDGLALTRRGLTLALRGPLTEAEAGEQLDGEHTTPPDQPQASEAARLAVAPLPGEPGLLDEPIARGLDRARELLRASRVEGGELRPALEQLAALSRELVEFPAAHLALVRWRVALSRFSDRQACLEAVHEWLDLQPSASAPRRLLAMLLAASDRAQDLARLLAGECRQPHDPITQARLELAVAQLLIDRLEDPRSALTIVAPLTQRLRELIATGRDRRSARRGLGGDEQPERASAAAARELLPAALVVLARARVAEVAREGRSLATVPHVLEALDEALEATRNPRRRADLRAAVADSFARYGGEHGDDRRGDLQALALLQAAIADDPDDSELLDRAIEIAARTDERATAAALLQARLGKAAAHERASLRKRLIAIAAELDDREHRELARRELAIALEHEPDNPVLLRRAAVLERKLGDARAAAEFIGRLLELDHAGEVELDDRDALLLDRVRLLRRAGQIDEAWESLRPALALVPAQPSVERDHENPAEAEAEQRWILDVIELALELAPPTDRPRILDQLIEHASGQRRGEALVERAAQALRVDERLADLWAAVDELDAPQKVLAQIEQLLDDRDQQGLARLAEVAAQLRERVTELHARARLGRALLEADVSDEATRQLERAVELGPDRLDLRYALAQACQQAERFDQAIPLLRGLLRDDREATPDDRGRLSLRLASLLRAVGASEEAAELLAGCERELARVNPELVSEAVREAVADQSFAALRELAEDGRALTVALEQATLLWWVTNELATASPELVRRLGAWLARAARVLDEAGVEHVGDLGVSLALPDQLPRTRVSLLERAVELRPDDHELADVLEAVLRELGDDQRLELLLRRRIDRNADPELRASLIERLIASLEAHGSDQPDRRRASELAELLEDLLVLRPEHTDAMLTLGRLRFEAGELTEARQLWTLAGERLDRDDPRFYRPAVELARAAIEDGELTRARELAERAHELEPRLDEPLLLLGEIARELDDPALAAEVLSDRLALADADQDADQGELRMTVGERAAVELELALTLADWFARDHDRRRASEAMVHFAAAEQLSPARTAAQDRRAALQIWLELALAIGDLEQQASARAALRETAGIELPVAELIAEIELLDRGLDRPAAALELCEWALAERQADPALVDALAQLLEHRQYAPELAERSQRMLRAVIKELLARPLAGERGSEQGRTQAAELLVDLGARLNDPASVAFGLDQLAPERVEHGELARLRDWAVRKLGRVHEEIASVESKLASGGLSSARRRALGERLLALHDHERERTVARLLELAERAEREVAALLADEALAMLEPSLSDVQRRNDPQLLELAIEGLRKLARYASADAVVQRWPAIEVAAIEAAEIEGVEPGAGLRPLASLVELAAATEHPNLGERADALLAEQLPKHPDDARLLRGLWSRSSGEVLLHEGERGRATIVARAAAWIEDLIDRRELDAATAAQLFDGLASLVVVELDEQAAATLLRQRAEAHVHETELFSALLQLLEGRRRWAELLSLLSRAAELELPPADRAEAWLAIAEAAEHDRDASSEARAREQAGELLGRRAGLFDDAGELDEHTAAQAIAELERTLELEPDHAALRWRVGLALQRLGHTRAAFEQLIVIWDGEQWSQAAIEIGQLALRSGELAAQLGEQQRAVELLAVAHARAGTKQRERATEGLFAALLALDRREEAVALASARASELEAHEAAVAWLRRAATLAQGPRKVELLTRACQLDPTDASASDELERELRALGELAALELLLRERIDRCRTAADSEGELEPSLRATWIATIEALVELLSHQRSRELDEQDEQADRDDRQAELVALHEELLELEPNHAEALLSVAAAHRRGELHEQAFALWARVEPLLGDDDPRLFEVACRLAERCASEREWAEAHRLLERALKLRPDDLDALEQRHALACALDQPKLVLVAASELLDHGAGLSSQRMAELHGDVARAHELLNQPAAALQAIEQAVAHVELGSQLHRALVERWLDLLADPQLSGDDPRTAAQRELAARTQLRRALGASLARADALREWDLLVELGEWERASELLEAMLIAEPEDQQLRDRLRQLDGDPARPSERGLRTLRRVVDALAPGPVRDQLACELARSSRALEAARTTLDALDRLSGQVAAAPEMLDLRVWAVRKLDRVEDELRELDSLLARAGASKQAADDAILIDRLLRVLEHDIEACATRLTELALASTEPAPCARAQVWLLESALTLLREHAPDRTALGVRALAALLERIGNPELLVEIDHDEQAARERVAEARRSWQQLAAAALAHASRDRRALEQVCALIEIAERAAAAALPGFAELGEMLLDRTTVDFPDHVPLHLLARRQHADPGVALERLERLADSHRMDPRARARLYLGLAATLSDEPSEPAPEDSGLYTHIDAEQQPRSPRRKFLRDLAGYHANEPAIFGPLREALRQLGAFTELFALFDAVAAEAEQWLELADDAGAAGDRSAEAIARRRAGNGLFERVMSEERRGGGLAASTLDRACAQLARAIELEPGDAKTEYEYGRALERAGRFAQAFSLLVPLIDEQRYPQAGVELGVLARRCGLLAIEIGELERATALLRMAYDALPRPRARISVAERLFELLMALARRESAEPSDCNEQALALARELAELVEAERGRAMSGADPGALAGLDPLPWLERAARLANDEHERANLYAKAHALAPDDERLADAYEASLRALGPAAIESGALTSLLRRRIASGLQAGDRARTVAQLERLLALLDPLARLREAMSSEPDARERVRDRAELLEQLLRLAPDRIEPRLELASLRLLEGDREAAAGHWRMLAQRLPSDDRRFLEPARALARFAIDSGELEQARAWLERARAIEPNDHTSLEQLLEVARGLDEPELVLSTSALLLAQTPDSSPQLRAALLRERARAHERLDHPTEALAEIREAAAVSEPGSEDHVEAARQWLRLATRDGVRVLLREEQAKAQAEREAEARAELRRALGQQLPARAYIAEAELLTERLDQHAQAIELLLTGLRRHLGDADLLATYEELCTVAGEQRQFVASLAELLATASFDDPSARVRLGEKLARSARAIDDARTCIDALEALPSDVAERPELLELRDWAVRGLGHVDQELARLDERIVSLDPGASPERLQAIVSRMLRLLGDAGEPVAMRLLELAETPELDPELARALARSALRVAREYAPERLGVAIAALRATLQRESIKAVAALWPGVESLALETNELGPLVELLALAIAAEREGEAGYGRRADRLANAALRLDPGDAQLHELLLARANWRDDELDESLARVCASLDGFAQELDLRGPALARMWSAAIERLLAGDRDARSQLDDRLAQLLRARAELAIDTPESFAALLELLRTRGRWDLVLDLLLRADQRRGTLELSELEAVAEAAARADDQPTRLRARVELGVRRNNQRDHAGAAEAFADALSIAPERADLQYRLGDALARAGRPDAALEHLLPLLGRPELSRLLDQLAEQLGIDSRAYNLRLDSVALARRCAELLVAVDSHERAATLFERALHETELDDPRREPIAEALFEARVRLADDEAAASLAASMSAELREQPDARVRWLLRVAEHGDPQRKVEALADAHALCPSDELAARLESALEALGEDDRLRALLHRRVEQARIALSNPDSDEPTRTLARERGAEALRKLIELRRAHAAEPDHSPESARELSDSWAQLLEFVPDDLEALLALAEAREQTGEHEAAAALWRRAGELLPADDDRFFTPAVRLAGLTREQGHFGEARALLERALSIRPGDHATLEAMRELAIAADDPELRLRAIEALLEQPERADQRAELELEAARAHALLAARRSRNLEPEPESLSAAVAAFERAAAAAEPGSSLQREIAKAWLEVVATDTAPLLGTDITDERRSPAKQRAREREARARAALRAAFGGNLAAGDLRTEASLLALGLGRVDEGLSLVESALLDNPDDPLLLSAFKDLCLATGAQERYAEALDAAIALLPDDVRDTRDRLATELAFTAVELEDANRLLAQLERMSPERASSPELLDLREWAIRKLGRVEDELTEIDEELLATSSADDTAVLVERLLRMLDQNIDETGRRLAMLAARAEPAVATRLRDATLELARSAEPSYFDVLLGTLEHSLADAAPGQAPTVNIAEHWAAIEKLALDRDDPGLLALLLDLGYRATESGLAGLASRVADLRDLALIRHPDSPELHALVFGALEVELAATDRDTRLARADAALEQLSERLRTTGRKRAHLWVGFAKLLERRDGAALLVRRARLEVDDNAVFSALVDALEEGNHWTRALELLEFRVARDGDPSQQVADLKHLAHLCADILGDPDAAIGHLERALEYAPEDPDLMLPLLDHYYAQPQLDRAIDLSARVLEHVPMGAVAFAALGHRAADAALATGEHALAEKLLRKILERAPDDARTRDRLRELEQLADDPEHRVRMLAAIANRTAGSARVEALEERARLLVAPLGRIEEAIADLEAVTEEAPGRRATAALLASLYEQRQRWPALVATLEREYPRQQGLDRVLTLERIALIQRDRLAEPARAEKALRLALDNLDSVGVDRLAELLDEHPRLRAELLDSEPNSEPNHKSESIEPSEPISELFESVVLPDELSQPEVERPPAEPVSLELARQAWARLADRLHLEIVTCLAQQGRFSELIAHLEVELAAEFAGEVDPRERYSATASADNPRLVLMQRLAKALREHVDDGERTAQAYVRLEQLDALPDEGLATLARWYRGQQRYDDLVRILTVRSRKLAALGDLDRKAEADFRIAELLEGPLRRPHEAARFFLDAYLANPFENPAAGARARVLLAGTDSVVNVRNRLLMRLPDLREDFRPALLTLLADLLAPHDDHEHEAERRYREALAIEPELPNALEGLGRLLSRQGRLEEAIEPLTRAARSPDIPDDRAADDAASAARALIELGRGEQAEAVLEAALARAPESQRPLLELAKLYDRLDRKQDEARILERLASLPLSSMLRAEVGYRQAMLLAAEFRSDPMSEAGERARALLLEAVGADAMHAQARQALLELANARSEWSIVAHMHFLAIRELPPGPRRALTHLDLAETYLDRLSDAQSAVRNLGAALQQAPEDVVVINRANTLAARMPDPADAAQRLEQISRSSGRPELGEPMTDNARARLLLVASDLHLRNDTLEPAEAAARAATELRELSSELRMQASLALDQIVQIDQGEFDLRKRRKSLQNKLEHSEDPVERLAVLARLRETARALDDREDLEDLTRRQLELAHALLEEVEREGEAEQPAADPNRLIARKNAALAGLRDVFAESGDYARVVSLYEDLAGRTGDANEAAELLTSAARFAWSGLRDPKLAVAIVRRALDRAPTHSPATELLGEIAGASDEPEVDITICDELSQLAPRQRAPLLTLRLAEAALRLERREHAQGVLRQLLAGEAPVELRLQASALLDGLLDAAGRTHDRIPLLEERLELCRRHWPDRAADVAIDLARAQRAVGNLQDARATCRTALLDKPSDQPLTKLYAELLEQAEDWPALARALEQLANLTIETREQAHWLTRAAQVHLDHGTDGRESLVAARRLLERARAVSIESTEARAVLLPLAFHQGDWERTLELAIELRAIAGDEHEALIYAALTEAFARGKRTLARSIGDRHNRSVRQRILWPVCARMLELIATEGPLPRLDALLSAAAALCGGTEELLDELGAWAAGQPLRAGLALGLARLNEAFRRMELARHLYQIAAFMAPAGPVPVLTTRLPPSELPRTPIDEDSWIPLEWRGALREVMLQLRDPLAGVRGKSGISRPGRTAKERLAIQHATQAVASWRGALGIEFTLAVTEQPLVAGIGIRNLAKPTIVVNEGFVDVPEVERRYRLAYAAAALATGLAPVLDDDPIGVPDLLDALLCLVKPRHEPTTDAARGLVDTLAARGLTASKLHADLRRSLARELDHWRSAPAKLERIMHRACMLIATRLSGHVDGALAAMARDRGLLTEPGKPVDPAVLETSNAAWLLRALGVFGGHG